MTVDIIPLLENAVAVRKELFDNRHRTALRLFNGFSEGCPNLVVDVYAATAVLYNHAAIPVEGLPHIRLAGAFLQEYLPWLRTGIVKTRNSLVAQEKRGNLLFGDTPDRIVEEDGVKYALDLRMNQDASLYLDTRNLRKWLHGHMSGKNVLNTFAYTGSLGAAALAGGAQHVVQLDLNRQFLDLGKRTYSLNGFPIHKDDFIAGDFWSQVNRYKRSGDLFDCVLVDPPVFSATAKGALDLNTDSQRLINKVRPLINDGGWLVMINNALYVSGQQYLETLTGLCSDGYLKLADLIPVPEDVTGFPHTRVSPPITDPSPFNHSTKIAVLEVKRKRT